MKTQPQLFGNDPPNKLVGTIAPQPPKPPQTRREVKVGCGCLKLIVITVIAFLIWYMLKG